jgi:hypothetical protein
MNRIEEPYFNKPSSNVLENKASASTTADSSSSDSSSLTLSSPGIDFKTIMIVLLIFFLVVSFFGITLMNSLGNFVQSMIDIFGPIINQFLNALGYSAGTALDKVSDVTADVAKGGIDLADGAINDIGGLLKGDNRNMPTSTANTVPPVTPVPPPSKNTPIEPPMEPTPDTSENKIQKPITSEKWNWCLVGEYQNKRGCVEITDSDKCMSGQVFPSQKMCLNPTWTP